MNIIKNNFWSSFYKIYISVLVSVVSIIVILLSAGLSVGFGFAGQLGFSAISFIVVIVTPIISVKSLLKFNKNYNCSKPLNNFRKFIMIPITLTGLVLSFGLSIYFIFFW